MDAIKIALNEFEHTQGWKVVSKTATEMEAVTTKGNIVHMRNDTNDQAETDRLWSALLANGGKESMCGWLIDRFGVSWQILPEVLPRLFNDPDAAAGSRARAAMMQMKKIDIAALEAAFRSA